MRIASKFEQPSLSMQFRKVPPAIAIYSQLDSISLLSVISAVFPLLCIDLYLNSGRLVCILLNLN